MQWQLGVLGPSQHLLKDTGKPRKKQGETKNDMIYTFNRSWVDTQWQQYMY
jgi:hypothetical protein